ncbi:HD domain-containing protein [Actinoplanes sp. NPDC026670]|uniref:HD domain-containing protein n=1 Tax=Actinoplanes sp. NPDC026670 TaxID=3154700 RepID=UPI0033CCE823
MVGLSSEEVNSRRLTSLVEAATVALTAPASGQESAATGFLITTRLVATCAHAVPAVGTTLPPTMDAQVPAAGHAITLGTADDRIFAATRGYDLALLEMTDLDQPLPGAVPVLLDPDVQIGDQLWSYGYPANSYRGGQAATFRFEGWSRRKDAPALELGRLRGTPVKAGASGSPVLNLRTGAVCGMLITSDHAGSAHMLSAAQLLECCPDARQARDLHATLRRPWLATLTDQQLLRGGWSYPCSQLRAYLEAAQRAADRHPYREFSLPTVSGRTRMPPLSRVYVHQSAASRTGKPAGRRPTVPAPVPAAQIFDQDGDFLLTGPAGSGKSSLLRMAALESIRRWQRDGDTVVPVRVQAQDLLGDMPLPEAIAVAVTADLATVGSDRRWPADFFLRRPLPAVAWLVLIDGFDEIVDGRHRQTVLDKIAGFRAGTDGSHRFVIATRPLPGLHFADDWPVQTYRLLPLTDRQFRRFATGWLAWLGVESPAESADRLLVQLVERGQDRFCRLPLVTMMTCHLYARHPGGLLPSSDVEVYRRFVALFNDRFFESGIRTDLTGLAQPYGDLAVAAVDRLVAESGVLLRTLAWAHRGEPDIRLGAAAIWHTRLIRPSHLSTTLWDQIVRGALRRSGLLIEHDDDFMFLHESIAEFLAADHVADHDELSRHEFAALLPDRAGDWDAARAAWQHPFARFLAHHWRNRPDLDAALRRAVRHGGLDACAFIAALSTDGITLSPRLRRMATSRLRRLARGPGDPARARTAAEITVVVDPMTARRTLADLATSRHSPTPDRHWAIRRLALLLEPEAVLTSSHDRPGPPRWAFDILARHPGGRDLLVRLARDHRSTAADRRAAGEALHAAGDLRGAGLLSRVAADQSITVQERRWAAETALEGPDGRWRPGRWRRARLALFLEDDTDLAGEVIDPLIAIHRTVHPNADLAILRHAFDIAARGHSGQFTTSGQPYVNRPVMVATILAELGMDTTTLIAALLQELGPGAGHARAAFGPEVDYLVTHLPGPDPGQLSEAAAVDAARTTIIAAAHDIRLLIISLAVRLRDMRILSERPRSEQERIAAQTRDLFVPLAARLGLRQLRRELEDHTVRVLYPNRYTQIDRMLSPIYARDTHRQAVTDLNTALRNSRVPSEVVVAPRTRYTVHQELDRPSHPLNDAADTLVLRLVVADETDCYTALGVAHNLWRPVPGSFRDHITTPEYGLYQSLHTTVISADGLRIELRIGTSRMVRVAEYGIAAPFRYPARFRTGVIMPDWLGPLAERLRHLDDPLGVWTVLRSALSTREISVFTPTGQMVTVTQDATPDDIAAQYPPNPGTEYVGVLVNGRPAAFGCPLTDGDIVEMLADTAGTATPTDAAAVRFTAARTAVRRGRRADPAHAATARVYSDPGLIVSGSTYRWIRLAGCCTPSAGDPIQGNRTHDGGIRVHRSGCPDQPGRPDRHVDVRWQRPRPVFRAAVVVQSLDRGGLLADVFEAIAVQNGTVSSANATADGRVMVLHCTVEVTCIGHLQRLIATIRRIHSVFDTFAETPPVAAEPTPGTPDHQPATRGLVS